MTSNETTETKRNVYDTCDPQYLRQLREAAGMDHIVLARTACLSVAQVRQLETDDSDNLFYSDAIKRQAYRRLLMILGAEPPTVEVPEDLRDAGKVAQAHLNTLDQIVAMSHQPALHRSTSDVLAAVMDKLKQHQQAVGALLLLLVAIALFVWNGMHSGTELSPAVSNASLSVVSDVAEKAVSVPMPTEVSSAPTGVASVPAPLMASAVASAPAISAALAASAGGASAVATSKLGACAYSADAMPQVTSLFAKKEGRYVYFASSANIEVCVVDGNKQATLLQLKAGDSRSVYGVPPWQLSSAGLQKAQIYFQGGRVSLPNDTTTRLMLVEVPVAR